MKHSSVGAGRQPGIALKKPTEKRRVFVPNVGCNFVGGNAVFFEKAFRLLNAEVLRICHQRVASSRLKSALQGAFRYAGGSNRTGDDIRISEVRGELFLSHSGHRIGMRLSANEALERELPLAMPFQQIDFRNAQRGSLTAPTAR